MLLQVDDRHGRKGDLVDDVQVVSGHEAQLEPEPNGLGRLAYGRHRDAVSRGGPGNEQADALADGQGNRVLRLGVQVGDGVQRVDLLVSG